MNIDIFHYRNIKTFDYGRKLQVLLGAPRNIQYTRCVIILVSPRLLNPKTCLAQGLSIRDYQPASTLYFYQVWWPSHCTEYSFSSGQISKGWKIIPHVSRETQCLQKYLWPEGGGQWCIWSCRYKNIKGQWQCFKLKNKYILLTNYTKKPEKLSTANPT